MEVADLIRRSHRSVSLVWHLFVYTDINACPPSLSSRLITMAAQSTVYSCQLAAIGTADKLYLSGLSPSTHGSLLSFLLAMTLSLESLLIPASLLYFSIYAHVVGQYTAFRLLILGSISGSLTLPFFSPIECAPIRSLQYCASINVLCMLLTELTFTQSQSAQ